MNAENLLSALWPDQVDHYELLTVLHHHYGSAVYPDDGRIIFPNSKDFAVKVRWGDGEVCEIEPGPGFRNEDFESVRNKVKAELVDSPGQAIAARILFSSSRPVTGHFQTANFQILPAPDDAVRPNVVIADHPFLLEFPFHKSTNELISITRPQRFAIELSWILTALLTTTIRHPNYRAKHVWALCAHDRDSHHSHWSQEMYVTPSGAQTERQEFTTSDSEPMKIVPHAEYYGRPMGLRANETLDLPDSLPQMLESINRLERSDQIRFMRAARWVYATAELWDIHISSWYIALVAAVECIAGSTAPPSQPCPNCKKDMGPGPTRKFREFLDRYIDESELEKRSKNRLYVVRSKLVHGNYLFDLDSNILGGYASPNLADEIEVRLAISWTVTNVLVRWLLDKGQQEGPHPEPVEG